MATDSPYKPLVSASILSADFTDLGHEIATLEEAGVDAIHLDVMDGAFVPNITFGPLVVEAIRRITSLPLDLHLMIEEPARYLREFADAGADWITIHIEACPHIHRDLSKIKEMGKRAGVAINPGTPISMVDSVLTEADLVLVMSVNPGFGGQKFISTTLDKLSRLQHLCEHKGAVTEIAADGGVDAEYAPQAILAGADTLVIGAGLFCEQGGPAVALSTILNRVQTVSIGWERRKRPESWKRSSPLPSDQRRS